MATCKYCNGEIAWRKMPRGKWQPVDPNGAVHFETCTANRVRGEPDSKPAITTYPSDPDTVFWDGTGVPWRTDDEEEVA